ncbi:MAG: electron transport complex subunit RsxC [Candidatus Ratteibacteria bacterium]
MIDYTKYRLKPDEEIKEIFKSINSVFIIWCKKCYKEFTTDIEPECESLHKILGENHNKIKGCSGIDFLCNNYHTTKRLIELNLKENETIGVLSCGIGIQFVASLFENKRVLALADSIPQSSNSTSEEGYHGMSLGKEKCAGCSQCYLNITGGICPIITCSKSLLNGPCGGAKNGKCEVNPELPCAWEEIYFRLQKQHRIFSKEAQIRNFNIFTFEEKKSLSIKNLAFRNVEFRGGIHPVENKHITENLSISEFPEPDRVIIFLSQHTGSPAKLIVQPGDIVKIGQKIGECTGLISSPVHASISGKVLSIEEKVHPSLLKKMPAIIIENNYKNDIHESIKPLFPDSDKETLLATIREKGIVGMGGAMFPTSVKLLSKKPIDTLIVNGCECEPYLNADNRLMIEYPDDIFKGIEVAKKILNVDSVIIGIEENKPLAFKKMSGIAIEKTNVKLISLKTKYPQGAEKILIRRLVGREVPEGGLPLDVGVVVLNIATLRAIYKAVYEGLPLIDRVITISGNTIKRPGNYLVKIGTPLNVIINFALDGDTNNISQKNVFMGGPMMGILQKDFHTGIIKGTTGITITEKYPIEVSEERECIKCGRCVEVCPVDLFPFQYFYYGKKQLWKETARYKVKNCIECASCQYVCPSKIDLLGYIKKAKIYAYNKTEKNIGD